MDTIMRPFLGKMNGSRSIASLRREIPCKGMMHGVYKHLTVCTSICFSTAAQGTCKSLCEQPAVLEEQARQNNLFEGRTCDNPNGEQGTCDEGECSRLACRVKWGAKTDAVRCW